MSAAKLLVTLTEGGLTPANRCTAFQRRDRVNGPLKRWGGGPPPGVFYPYFRCTAGIRTEDWGPSRVGTPLPGGRKWAKAPPPTPPPLYIFILCNKYKKKAGRRQGWVGTPPSPI